MAPSWKSNKYLTILDLRWKRNQLAIGRIHASARFGVELPEVGGTGDYSALKQSLSERSCSVRAPIAICEDIAT
jgi:hypothetical protein